MIERQVALDQRERFAKTIQFIEAVIAEGTHETVPEYLTEDQWQDKLDATLTYLLSPPDISLEKTGNIYNQGREWTRTARNSTTRILYKRALPPTQEFFGPLKQLELNKPKLPPKENIIFAAEQEKSKRPSKYEELINKLKNAKTYEEKQELLNLVPFGLYSQLTKGDDPFLMPVKNAIVKTGYHVRLPQDSSIFHKSLKTNRVPMGEIERIVKKGSREIILRYHFIYAKDEKRVTQVWSEEKHLQRFQRHPVSQIAGPPQKELPITTSLKKRTDFGTTSKLFFELGIESQPLQKEYRTLLLAQPDLPTPIYYYGEKYLYSMKDEDRLRSYAKQLRERALTAA